MKSPITGFYSKFTEGSYTKSIAIKRIKCINLIL